MHPAIWLSSSNPTKSSLVPVLRFALRSDNAGLRRWAAEEHRDRQRATGLLGDVVVVAAALADLPVHTRGLRVVDLHPMTVIQNARTSGGGNITMVPGRAVTVGPVETWQSAKVSIWQAGQHDNPFGQRLTALMISKKIPDSSVPMSLIRKDTKVELTFPDDGGHVSSVVLVVETEA